MLIVERIIWKLPAPPPESESLSLHNLMRLLRCQLQADSAVELLFCLLPALEPSRKPLSPHWGSVSWSLLIFFFFFPHMILYMFQCHSPKSSHPHRLPQSPKDCSIHQCLFSCLAYRVIVTIFLNSISADLLRAFFSEGRPIKDPPGAQYFTSDNEC